MSWSVNNHKNLTNVIDEIFQQIWSHGNSQFYIQKEKKLDNS